MDRIVRSSDISLENETGPSGEITPRTLTLDSKALQQLAKELASDEKALERMRRQLDARMHLTHAHPERVGDSFQRALQIGGHGELPQTSDFPLTVADSLSFENREELEDHVNGLSSRYVEEHRSLIVASLEDHRLRANQLMTDLTHIAQARVAGVQPEDILTDDDMQLMLSTRVLTHGGREQIVNTRNQLVEVAKRVLESDINNGGVSAEPLAKAAKDIADLCAEMEREMRDLRLMTLMAHGERPESKSLDSPTEKSALTARAKAVFEPSIYGSNILTQIELKKLNDHAKQAGSQNAIIATILEEGMSLIADQKQTGDYRAIAAIEKEIGFDELLRKLELSTRGMNGTLGRSYRLLGYAATHNDTVFGALPKKRREALMENSEAILPTLHSIQARLDERNLKLRAAPSQELTLELDRELRD